MRFRPRRSTRSTRSARSTVAGLLVVVLTASGCSQLQAQREGSVREDGDGRAAPASADLIETLEWGELDGLVSVRVRNNSDRVLARADATINVRDDDGNALGSSAGTTVQGACCTAVEVPPGGEFGFYFYAGDAADVDDVEVSYENVQFSEAADAGGGEIRVEPLSLFPNAAGSVVSADTVTVGAPVRSAIVQAVVDGPDGELAAVISGTWFCFVPGPERRIWMQLYTDVPRGSTIRSVTAYPLPDDFVGGDANVGTTCSADTGPGGTSNPVPTPAPSGSPTA